MDDEKLEEDETFDLGPEGKPHTHEELAEMFRRLYKPVSEEDDEVYLEIPEDLF